jgi:hypothetical protein
MDKDIILQIFRQLVVFFPWFILNVILFVFLIWNRKKIQGKFYTTLFYSSITLSFLSHLLQAYIQYSMANHGLEETKYLYQLSAFTYPSFLFYSMGIIGLLIEEKVLIGYKESVWLLFFLGVITGGFYGVYWYLKRNIQFTKSVLAKIVFVFLCYFFYMYFALLVTGSDIYGGLFMDKFFAMIIVLSIYLGFLISVTISIFTIRNGIIREGMECDPLATFFFGPLYLQYKINQLADYRAERADMEPTADHVIE